MFGSVLHLKHWSQLQNTSSTCIEKYFYFMQFGLESWRARFCLVLLHKAARKSSQVILSAQLQAVAGWKQK